MGYCWLVGCVLRSSGNWQKIAGNNTHFSFIDKVSVKCCPHCRLFSLKMPSVLGNFIKSIVWIFLIETQNVKMDRSSYCGNAFKKLKELWWLLIFKGECSKGVSWNAIFFLILFIISNWWPWPAKRKLSLT